MPSTPCFALDSLILTTRGYVHADQITLTDRLISHTGIPQKILNIQVREYDGELCAIQIRGRQKAIHVTPDHPFCTRTPIAIQTGQPTWKSASTLTTEDHTGMCVSIKNTYPDVDSYIDWYWLGYYVGGGRIPAGKFSGIPIISRSVPEWAQDAPVHCLQRFMNGFAESDNYYGVTPITRLNVERIQMKIESTRHVAAAESEDTLIVRWTPVEHILTYTPSAPIYVYNFQVPVNNSYIVENTIVQGSCERSG
jgi:hypothetical protein